VISGYKSFIPSLRESFSNISASESFAEKFSKGEACFLLCGWTSETTNRLSLRHSGRGPRPRWESPIALQFPRCCITKGVKGSNDGDPPSSTGSHSDGHCQKAGDNRQRNNNGVDKQPRPSPLCCN